MPCKLNFIIILAGLSLLPVMFWIAYLGKNHTIKTFWQTRTRLMLSRISIPVIILHPKLTHYCMLSVWQARQLNEEVHVLYDHNGTVKESCQHSSMNNHKCFTYISVELQTLADSLKSINVFFIDINKWHESDDVKNFTLAFKFGNNKTIFDHYHPGKWEYEKWCALRWLYVYKYAKMHNFDIMYIQDSDVLLYGNVTIEFDNLQPTDAAISGSTIKRGSSGHNTFLRVTVLRSFLNFMTETWRGNTDVAEYVRRNLVSDMFYFTHFFEDSKVGTPRRVKGVIVSHLDDPYYDKTHKRSSARAFDRLITDNFDGRYLLRNITLPDGSTENLKKLTWITENGESFHSPNMFAELIPRYPAIHHVILQQQLYLIDLHFVGYRKKFMAFFTQRYLRNVQIDRLLNITFLPNRTMM